MIRRRLILLALAVALLRCEIRDVDGLLRVHVIAVVKDTNKQPVTDAGVYIESQTTLSKPQTTLICRTDGQGRCENVADHPFHVRNIRFGSTRTRVDHRILIRGAGVRDAVLPLHNLTRAQAEGREPLVVNEIVRRSGA